MKKIPLFLMLTFSCCLSAQHFKYGVSGDFHKGSIVNVHDASKGKYGGGLGGFVQWPLVENDVFDSAYLYLEPHVDFNTQGEIAKAENEIQKYSSNYVSMSVYFRFFFHQGNMKRDLFLFAGPRVEYLVSYKRDTSQFYEDAYYKFNLDNKVNRLNYGVTVGTGLQISQQWEAFLRYDRGFAKFYSDNPANTYNRLLAIGLNYYIKSNW
ncbi:outer membrane beta-barrel protein [Halpernia frigidisoli]|uniref:Outer membrane protein beta-barrel domain-containing protein n=1 Tax=Halpernia frigidisoli TaxID=1125876 RepID=A0A1I3FEZ1_9FLAO|nr:outer membrane beta-barrel protein [Halpernia frigidisoli]SFI09788.1 Outer membrane protein beta-barrel domain-containing protein [Halpernia frigidisoli]